VVARRFPLPVTKVPIQRRQSKNHIQSDINQFLVSQMLRPGPNRVNGLIVGEKSRLHSLTEPSNVPYRRLRCIPYPPGQP
jgi:hypothetical protein